MFTNDKSALLQSLLFPVLIIIWGIARTVTDFLYAGGISAFTRLDALWRYVCFGAIICSVIAIIITLCYNTLWKGRYVTLLFKKAYRHMRTGCFIRRCNELRHKYASCRVHRNCGYCLSDTQSAGR